MSVCVGGGADFFGAHRVFFINVPKGGTNLFCIRSKGFKIFFVPIAQFSKGGPDFFHIRKSFFNKVKGVMS